MAESEYPHVEIHAIAWLADATGKPVYTETDTALEAAIPASKVEVVGGSGSGLERTVLLEVDSFGKSRAEAWELGRANDAAMLRLANSGTPDWYVDDVRCTFHPSIQPYTNQALRRTSAIYELTIRPR